MDHMVFSRSVETLQQWANHIICWSRVLILLVHPYYMNRSLEYIWYGHVHEEMKEQQMAIVLVAITYITH